MDDFDRELHEDLEYIISRGIVYRYLDLTGGVLMLRNCTLQFKNPRYFNDPYDCYEGLMSFVEVPDHYREDVIRRHRGNFSPAELKDVTAALYSQSKEQMASIFKNSLIEYEISSSGLCSLSEENDNLLMWAHYADKHQGVCVGLDIIKLRPYIASMHPVLIKVKYTSDFKTEEFFVSHRRALSNCYRTKAVLWKYEKEIRIVLFQLTFNANHQFFLEMGREVISEIYLGSKIKLKDEQEIISICKESYPMSKVRKMRLAEKSFKLIPEQLQSENPV